MRLAPTVNLSGRLASAPNGDAAPYYTLRLMRDAIQRARVDPALIQSAHAIVYLAPERDQLAEARALFEYVRDSVRYVQDVYGLETLTEPQKVLLRLTGDCDDQTALLCALFESIGYPTRLVMGAFQSEEFDHVYCQVNVNGIWYDADPIIREHELGDAPGIPFRLYVEEVRI